MAEISKSSLSNDKSVESRTGAALDSTRPLVFVLDDDLGVREAFSNAADFLRAGFMGPPACLILDLQLPDISGLDIQQQLAEADGPPVIFISGHGDIPTSVRAMKAGAIEFLPKPFSDSELFSAIDSAISKGRERQRNKAEIAELRKSFARLSAREREVFQLVVAGRSNKSAAAALGIAEITLQVHRAQVMRKMAASSLPDLVRMAGKLVS